VSPRHRWLWRAALAAALAGAPTAAQADTAVPPAAPPPALPRVPALAPAAPTVVPSGLREPAPRPNADVRVQNRFVRNASAIHLFGGVDYLERRDFYISPGIRLGATYYLRESLGLELQVSRFFSVLNQSALQVEHQYGVVPDSRPPGWLAVAGVRYAIGYGKMVVGGMSRSIHFQPQALLQLGMHVEGDHVGPSGVAGIGLLVNATAHTFVRLDGAMTLEREARLTGPAMVLGFLPSLVVGGIL
jgi:hypothetical protein